MTTALLLIDFQNDYFPGGAMAVEGSVEASLCAARLLSRFRKEGMPVVHVRHLSIRPGAAFLVPGTRGAVIHENVKPLAQEAIIEKNYPNSFRDTPLLERLRKEGIGRLIIAGMMTHMCVDATARAAFDYGFACTVVGDACATRALAFEQTVVPALHVHAAFLAALNAVYARVIATEAFCRGDEPPNR